MTAQNKYETIRHCPGSDAITGKVLKQITLKNPQPEIANICCGTGEQALLLAKKYKSSHITAIDEDGIFFSDIERKSKQANIQDRIKTVRSGWDKLTFEKESLDMILSEGAFEHLDFGKRLVRWRQYIKPGGYLAMSELCLLTNKGLPTELYDYFNNAYPYREIETIDYHINQIRDSGYRLHTRLTLPDECWQAYYKDMKKQMGELFGDQMDDEYNDFYQTYKEYIGYVYFVARKVPLISNDSIYATELNKQQRNSLQNHLIDKLSGKECNNTLRFTEYWLSDNIVRENHEVILKGFRGEGGYCDCEVLANVFHIIMEGDDE